MRRRDKQRVYVTGPAFVGRDYLSQRHSLDTTTIDHGLMVIVILCASTARRCGALIPWWTIALARGWPLTSWPSATLSPASIVTVSQIFAVVH